MAVHYEAKGFKEPIKELTAGQKETLGLLEQFRALGFEHATKKEKEELEEVLDKVLPMSRVIEREVKKERKNIKRGEKDLDKFIRMLTHKDFFHHSLKSHLLAVNNKIAELKGLEKRGFPEAKVRSVWTSLSEHLQDIAVSLEHGKHMFLVILKELSPVLREDEEWNTFIRDLRNEVGSIKGTHPPHGKYHQAFQHAAHTLNNIMDEFGRSSNYTMNRLVRINQLIQEGLAEKKINFKEVSDIIDKLTTLLIFVENHIYHELLPQLYGYKGVLDEGKKLTEKEQRMIKALEDVYVYLRSKTEDYSRYPIAEAT
ncbi:hypothetical protein GOV11_03820 [Candidatus Woesearchaeota archaeon]|nr:hypothetical protein [Candidatus Woesearchaeota archaeon]